MKQTLLIFLLLLVSTISVGQANSSHNVSIESYNSIVDLKLKKSVKSQDLIGVFNFQGGSYQWIYLTLDSNMTYRIRSQDCLSRKLIDSGYWCISFERMLTLQTSRKRILFDILQRNQKYYLVEPAKRAEFIQTIKDTKPLTLAFFSKPI